MSSLKTIDMISEIGYRLKTEIIPKVERKNGVFVKYDTAVAFDTHVIAFRFSIVMPPSEKKYVLRAALDEWEMHRAPGRTYSWFLSYIFERLSDECSQIRDAIREETFSVSPEFLDAPMSLPQNKKPTGKPQITSDKELTRNLEF